MGGTSELVPLLSELTGRFLCCLMELHLLLVGASSCWVLGIEGAGEGDRECEGWLLSWDGIG